MAKDPAFLFYPNDWIGGTMGMTFHEKGAYMEVLMMQFNRGHMTSHMIGQVVGQTWDNIKHKFVQDSENLWFNERLDLEIKKRKNFTKSRRNNISGKNQHNKDKIINGHMEGHMTYHMENENENINEDIIVLNKNGKKFISSDFSNLPDQYFEVIKRQIKTIKQMSINDFQIKDLWECFKVEKLTGDKWFNTESEVYSYFTNWIKNQKFSENDNRTNQEKQIDFMHEYIYGSSGRKDS